MFSKALHFFLFCFASSAITFFTTSALAGRTISKDKAGSGGDDAPFVRDLVKSDLSALKHINRTTKHPWPETNLERPFSDDNRRALVVEKDGQVVGYLFYEVRDDELVLEQIAVDPAHRRDGIGTMLAHQLKIVLNSSPQKKIIAEVLSDLSLQPFFEGLGYKNKGIVSSGVPSKTSERYELSGKDYRTKVIPDHMINIDIKEVLEIDRLSSEFPWSEEELRKKRKDERTFRVIVAKTGQGRDAKVVGFMAYNVESDRIALRKFAVHPDYRRSGVGEQLADYLKREINPSRRPRIVVEIPITNTSGRTFFKKQDFRKKKRIRRAGQGPMQVMQHHYGQRKFAAEMLKSKNHFDRLEVKVTTPLKAIRESYKSLLEDYLPGPEEKRLLKESLRVLTNETKRRNYINSNRAELLGVRPALVEGSPANIYSPDLYERMGTFANASPETIERSYDVLYLLHGDEPNTMAKLDEAHRILQQPLRAQYDALISSTEGSDRDRAVVRFLDRFSSVEPVTQDQLPFASQRAARFQPEPFEPMPAYNIPKPAAENLYQRLGIPENASQSTIVDAYASAMIPLRNDEAAQERINEAYRVLGNPELRATYDYLNQERPDDYSAKLSDLISKSARTHAPKSPENDGPPSRLISDADPESPELYQRLGVPENARSGKIVEAYVKVSQKYSNDLERLQSIRIAFQILRNDDFKRDYDHIRTIADEEVRKVNLEQFYRRFEDAMEQAKRRRPEPVDDTPRARFGEPDLSARADLYEVLGLGKNSSASMIEKAFFSLHTHPDPKVRERAYDAYSVLKYPNLRWQYDSILKWGGNTDELVTSAKRLERVDKLDFVLTKTEEEEPLRDFLSKTNALRDSLPISARVTHAYLQKLHSKVSFHKNTDVDTLKNVADILDTMEQEGFKTDDARALAYRIREVLADKLAATLATDEIIAQERATAKDSVSTPSEISKSDSVITCLRKLLTVLRPKK